jgi:hypothetical protein
MEGSCRQTTRGGPPAWKLGVGQTFTVINHLAMKASKESRAWTDSSDKRPELRNMDMRVGTWDVRSLMTVSRELAR